MTSFHSCYVISRLSNICLFPAVGGPVPSCADQGVGVAFSTAGTKLHEREPVGLELRVMVIEGTFRLHYNVVWSWLTYCLIFRMQGPIRRPLSKIPSTSSIDRQHVCP